MPRSRDSARINHQRLSSQAIAMWAAWIGFAISAYLDTFFLGERYESTYFMISTIAVSLLLFTWFLCDARSIGLKPSPGLKIAVLALGIVAVPYYLIRYKGLMRFGLSFLKFLGLAGLFLAFVYFVVPDQPGSDGLF